MSNTVVDELAVNKSGRTFPNVEQSQANQAVSILLPFAKIKHLLECFPAPKRPSRIRPIHSNEAALRGELDAWEAASDEAFESMEGKLPEQS